PAPLGRRLELALLDQFAVGGSVGRLGLGGFLERAGNRFGVLGVLHADVLADGGAVFVAVLAVFAVVADVAVALAIERLVNGRAFFEIGLVPGHLVLRTGLGRLLAGDQQPGCQQHERKREQRKPSHTWSSETKNGVSLPALPTGLAKDVVGARA